MSLRVLVVEDSLTVRRRLCEVIEAESGLEVVGEAENGQQAIDLCQRLRPDVVTMDIVLPEVDGLAATEYIMAHCPTPILIVSSSYNRGELFHTYEALAAGAVDVLDKPSGDEPDGSWEQRFLSRLRLVAKIKVITHPRARLARPKAWPEPVVPLTGPVQCIGLGASTGGPGALLAVLRALPTELGLPVLVVIHLNERFESAFASWLSTQTTWPAQFARGGERVAALAGRVVLAPSHKHMIVQRGFVRLVDGAERHSCKPSVDVLFESLAQEYGASALACLLTGMGRDGATGLLAVRQAGGYTIAQDESSSVVYGMPREAALLGAAREVLPLSQIGPRLAGLARSMAR